jgi:hypothetical protein
MTDYMKYLLVFIIFVFTIIIGIHFLKTFNIIEGLENEEVAMPAEEVAMPAEEVAMPAEEVAMPAEEVNTISNEPNVESKNEGKPIAGHSLTTTPVTPYVTTTISVAPPVIQSQPKQNIPIMKFDQYKQEIPAKSQPANITSNKTNSNTGNSKNIERTPIKKKSF